MEDTAPRSMPQKLARGGIMAAVVALFGALTVVFRMPILFPALGPTLLLVARRPAKKDHQPLQVLLGHAGALAFGVLGLLLFGLFNGPSPLEAGFTWRHVASATLAMLLTAAAGELESLRHPPAAATALLVGMGLLSKPAQLAGAAIGIVLIALFAFVASKALKPYLSELGGPTKGLGPPRLAR